MGNKIIKNEISLLSLLILVFLIFLFSLYINRLKKEINYKYFNASLSQTLVSKQITLMFVGDIMLDRGVEWSIKKNGKEDFKFPFLKIGEDLKKPDILFGNLESVISDKGTKVGSIYSFRANPRTIEGLIHAGFDLVSVANNHVFDYGRAAMEDSFIRLTEAGINYLGGGFSKDEAYSPVIKQINKTKIAFLAYTNLGSEYWLATDKRSGIAWLDEKIKENIGFAKESADLVVVSMHFGEEYKTEPNKEQIYFSRLAIDYGANLVIGHHPHVVQKLERYKTGYIAYSLGNFVFDQSFSEETMKGLLLKVIIENNKIKKITPIEIEINDFFQPELAD